MRVSPLSLALVLGASLLASTGHTAANPATLFDNPVLAKGKGFEIRQLELDDAITALKATLATQNQAISPREEPELRARMLERMILTRLLVQRATAADKSKARELADKFIADTKSKAPSEESYRRQLLATGLKPEVFEQKAFEQAVVEKVLEREIKAKLTVTDEQVRQFYLEGIDLQAQEVQETAQKIAAAGNQHTGIYQDATNRLAQIRQAHLARLERPEQVKAHLILFYTVDPVTRGPLVERELAAKLALATNTVKRLRAGADFATVAREVSEDPDVARTGGEYTASARTAMAPELLEALFRLPLNQVSDPIATRFGLYIARVDEKIPAGKLAFEQIAPELREILLTQGVERRLPAFAEQLRKEYEVQILDPDLAK
ncbi:MAG: peptidylprolyl isomerase [Verrucomicrobia bacterium]|nr:peptidylprolyl isomerase [Verrucomicrobiota bacterium]